MQRLIATSWIPVVLAVAHAIGCASPAATHQGGGLADLRQRTATLGKYGESAGALRAARQALALAERKLDPDDPQVAYCSVAVAEILAGEDVFEEAIALYDRALVIREHAFGTDSLEVASTLSKLASTLDWAESSGREGHREYGDRLGRTRDRARAILESRLATAEAANGSSRRAVADCLCQLAEALGSREYARAQALLKRALEIRDAEFGRNSSESIEALRQSTRLAWARGDDDQAQSLIDGSGGMVERALAMRAAAAGAEQVSAADREVAAALGESADAARNRALWNDTPELRDVLLDAVDARLSKLLSFEEIAFGARSAQVAGTLCRIGALLIDRVQHGRATDAFRRAVAIREGLFGRSSPEVASALDGLARSLRGTDRASAEAQLLRALAIREREFGIDSTLAASTLSDLADLCIETESYERGEALYDRALAIHERSFGSDSPAVINVLRGQLSHYESIALDPEHSEYLSRAACVSERLVAIHERAFGPDSPAYADELRTLAFIRRQQARHSRNQVSELLERALAIDEAAFGEESPEITDSLEDLADFLLESSIDDGASTAALLLQRKVDIAESKFGRDSRELARELGALGAALSLASMRDEAREAFVRSASILERMPGPRSRELADAFGRVADVAEDQTDLQGAREACRSQLAVSEEIYGMEDPRLRPILERLAWLNRKLGDRLDAEACDRRSASLKPRDRAP